jgi:choline-sulfatase
VTNVLILMSDEHNFRVSSVYAHTMVDTPNMDRLAAEGVVYDAAYCPSPLCAPSRSSLMSGLPVHQNQVYNNCSVMQFEHPSYGSELDRQGIYSAYIGKTDVYRSGVELGFTEMISPGDRKPPGDINFSRQPLSVRDDGAARADGYGVKDDAFARDTRNVDQAVAWLSDTAPRLDLPWTLTVNINAPHFPHFVTADLWEKYRDSADLPSHGADAESANHPYALDLRKHFQTDAISADQARGLRRGYLGGVDFVDAQLGRLLDVLEATGQRDGTVVAYASDHGEMLGKFGMWWKCSMYEDSVRVPLIMSGPDFARGTRIGTPVSLLDLQSSMFRATGAERPNHWWGTPLQDVTGDDPDRIAFAEYHGHGTRSGSFMIRKGDWKLLYHAAAPHQLFDLSIDPEELENRYETEPETASDLEAELRQLCSPELENRRAHDFEHAQMASLNRTSA